MTKDNIPSICNTEYVLSQEKYLLRRINEIVQEVSRMKENSEWQFVKRWKITGKDQETDKYVHIYVCAATKLIADEIATYIPRKFWIEGK